MSRKSDSVYRVERGAGGRTRTDDLLITNQLLYQLSYAGRLVGADGAGAPRQNLQSSTTGRPTRIGPVSIGSSTDRASPAQAAPSSLHYTRTTVSHLGRLNPRSTFPREWSDAEYTD